MYVAERMLVSGNGARDGFEMKLKSRPSRLASGFQQKFLQA